MSYFIKTDITKPVELPDHPYTFSLDPFQQHAIRVIANDEHVLICAKTGSGKSLVAEYQIYHSLKISNDLTKVAKGVRINAIN